MPQEEPTTKPVYVTPTAGERGMTALHHAAYSNDPDAVLEQLALGTPVDARDDGGWTPLHWSIDMAQAWGDPNLVVSLLLAHGASANAADTSGFTVLMRACGRNNENIFAQLVEAGADIHARSAYSSPLHEAAACNFHEAIAALLRLGADPTRTDDQGRTPLQLAEHCGFDEAAAVLRSAWHN
jgi:ankyrin repeat protein